MSDTFGGWFDPTALVDLVFWFALFIVLVSCWYYRKYLDKRYGDQKAPRENFLIAFAKFVLVICLVWIPTFVIASLYLNSQESYWEGAVTDTDYVGNTTNTTITKIGCDARYVVEHQLLLPFPDYEEDILIYISDTSLNGNGTMVAYLEALDVLGNVKYNKSVEKVLTDLDGEFDALKFSCFESKADSFRLVQFLNGTTDTDLFTLNRDTEVVSFNS